MDLENEAMVAAVVTFADRSDPASAPLTLTLAQANLVVTGPATSAREVVMDKGHHDNGLLAWRLSGGCSGHRFGSDRGGEHRVA